MRTYYIYDENLELIGVCNDGRAPSDFQMRMYLDMGYLIISKDENS
jgi:hypothetical protein